MNIFPGSRCTLRAFLLIVFTWNVRGQTQGGGVSIGLDADFMMDTAFGELPSPLVAMAAEGTGTGLGGSGQGSFEAASSQTGSGLNTQSFSMSGLDPSSVHHVDTSSIVGVANGQTIFLPGFSANDIFSGLPIILPATTTSPISRATDPNTDYVLRNEEFTALGKVGHLVKVPVGGVVAQDSTSNVDTSSSTFLDGLSISADGAITIDPSHIIGVADMSQMGASGAASIYKFKPGTSHASELEVLQASAAGKAVDMTDMLPPPLDHEPTYTKPNLNANNANDITSVVNNTSLNVLSIDNQQQSQFLSSEFLTMAEGRTSSESGTKSSLTPITNNKRHNTLMDLSNSVASIDQSMININEESMFNEISSNNQTDFLTLYDQSVSDSNIQLGSLDQWLADVNDPVTRSAGSFSDTLVDKGSSNTGIQTDIMNTNVNVTDKMQSHLSTVTGLIDPIITGRAPTKHVDITKALHEQNKVQIGNVNNEIAQISKSSELDTFTKNSVNISDIESSLLNAEKVNTEMVKQNSNSRVNIGKMGVVNQQSNGNREASFGQNAVDETSQFEVGATVGVRRRPNPVTTMETGTFGTFENAKAQQSTSIGNPASSKSFSEMTSEIVTKETSSKSEFTGSNSPTATITDNSGSFSDISSNTVNINTASSMNVQQINQSEAIIPHVSDLSSEGLFPFEGSFNAMDATLSEGIPAILDMNSVLEGHEPLHIEPTTNIFGELLTDTAPAHLTSSGIYAVANSGFLDGGEAQTNRSGTENTVIGFFSTGKQSSGNNEAMEAPVGSNIDTIGKIISMNSENTLVELGLDRKTAISDTNPIFVYAESSNNTGEGLEVAGNNKININRNTTNSQGAFNININTAVTDAADVALSRYSGAPITNMVGVSAAQVNGGMAVSGTDGQSFVSNSPLASSSQEVSSSVDQITVENADISSGSFIVGAGMPNSKIISKSSVGGLAIGSGNPDIQGISLPQRAFREDQQLNQKSKSTDSTKSVKVDMSSFIPPPFEETTGNSIANQQQFNIQEQSANIAINTDKSTLRNMENSLQSIRKPTAKVQPSSTATVQTDQFYNFNTEMFGAADTSSLSFPEARRSLTPNTVPATKHFGKTPNGNNILTANQANKGTTGNSIANQQQFNFQENSTNLSVRKDMSTLRDIENNLQNIRKPIAKVPPSSTATVQTDQFYNFNTEIFGAEDTSSLSFPEARRSLTPNTVSATEHFGKTPNGNNILTANQANTGTTGNSIANQQQFNFQENSTNLSVSKDKSTLSDIENNLQNIRNQIAQLQPSSTATVQTDQFYNFNTEMFGAEDTSSLSFPEARRSLTPNTVPATEHFGKTPNGNNILTANQANTGTTGNSIANQQQFNFQENSTNLSVSKDKSTLSDIENNLQNIRNQIAQLQPSSTAIVQTDQFYNFNTEMFGAEDTSSLSFPEARRSLTPNTVPATEHFGKTPNGNNILTANQVNKNPTLTTNIQYNDGVSSNILQSQNAVDKATMTNSNSFKPLSDGINSQQSGMFTDFSSIQNNRFAPLNPMNQNLGGISIGQFSDKPLVGNIFGGVDSSTSTETKANAITQKFLEKTGITREPAVDFMSSFLKPSLSSAKSNIKNVDIIQLESTKLDEKISAAKSDANIVDQFGVADIYTRKQELNPAQWQQFMAQNSRVAKVGQNVGNIDYVTKNVVGKEELRPLNENFNNKRSFTDISNKRSDAVMTQTNVDINNQFLTGSTRANENIGNQGHFIDTTRSGEGINNRNILAKKPNVIETINNQNSFTGTRGAMPRRESSDGGNGTPRSRNTDRSGSARSKTLDSAIIFEAPGMTGHKSVTIANYRPKTFEPYQASKAIFNAETVSQQELRNVKGVSQQRPIERPVSNIAVNQQQLDEFVGSQTIAQRSSEFANSLQQNQLNGGTQSIVKAGMLSQGGRQAGSDQMFGSFSVPTGTAGSPSSVIALDQDQLTTQLTLDQGQLGETGKRIQDEMNTFKLGKSILISDGVIPDFAGPNSIQNFHIDASDMQSLSAAGMRLGEPSVLPNKVRVTSDTPGNAQSTFLISPSALNGGTNAQNVQSSKAITTSQMTKSDLEVSSQNNVNRSNRNLGIAINENMGASGITRQENRMLPTNQLINQKNVAINNQQSDSVFTNEFSSRANNKGASFGGVDQNELNRNTGLGRLRGLQAGSANGQQFSSQNVGIAVSDVFDINSSTFDQSFSSSTNMHRSGDNARMNKAVQSTSSDTATILGLNDALVKQPMEPTLFTSGNRFAVFGHANDVAGKAAVKQMTKPIPARRMGVLAPVHDCRYKPDPTSEYYFIFKNGITQHRFRCALGTAFDEMTCECSIRVSDHGDCLEVHMDFNNGVVEDSSLNRLPIGNENVEITNSSSPLPGIALFSGDSKLTIWRYQNYDFRDHIMLKVQFRPGVGGDRNQPLITNCDGSPNGPAVGIVYDNVMQEVVLLLKTVNDTGKELRFAVNANEWNDVTYIYDGQEFIGIVNGVRRYVSRENPHLLGIIGGEIKSTPAQGLIEIQDAAIVLGHCPMFGYFRGAMVDIQIYTCIPKDFRLE